MDNERVDALSRRDQDLLRDVKDDCLIDWHIRLLRLEVLAVNARVIAILAETRRARTRADDAAKDDTAGDDTIKDNTGKDDTGNALQADVRMSRELADASTIVGKLLNELAD